MGLLMPCTGVSISLSNEEISDGYRMHLLAKESLVTKPTLMLSRSGVRQNVTLQMLRTPETLVTELA
jgi:hypothetical protein